MIKQTDERFLLYHDNALFKDCVDYTANLTGFSSSLIEKDFFCSLVLSHLFDVETLLVFKGGTLISKVYANFYRLSEDLDFLIPMDSESTRSNRKKLIGPLKSQINDLTEVFPDLTIEEPLAGHNESRQYIAILQYPSFIAQQPGTIKLEISMREPLLLDRKPNNANTILRNPYSLGKVLPLIPVRTLSLREAYAEKVRAALTRQEPAIRDFFDIDYALKTFPKQIKDKSFPILIRRKIAIPGNSPINVTSSRKAELARQMETHLKPVLRPQDYSQFDLEQSWQFIAEMAKLLR